MIARATIKAMSVPSAVLGGVLRSALPFSPCDSPEFSELAVPLLSEPVFDESDGVSGVLSEDVPPLDSPVAGITTGAVISFLPASSENIFPQSSQVQ